MNTTDLIIPLNGLAAGRHVVEGRIGTEFFEEFGNSGISAASLDVRVAIEKSGQSSIQVQCSVNGRITVTCDRCLEDLELPVSFSRRMTVKFSSEDADGEGNDEVMVLNDSDCDLDMSQYVYDYVVLCIPIRKVHEEGGCNPEVMRILNARNEAGQTADSPFSQLRNLFGNGDLK